MTRAILIVLDSFGIGGAPDAAAFGDDGANTLGHIADAFATEGRTLALPWLTRLGLARAAAGPTGATPAGLDTAVDPIGAHAWAVERSTGKDTTSGHWELAGVPVTERWRTFSDETASFPAELIDPLIARADLPGVLGNCRASGTEIIARLGAMHVATGRPIVYTSADSVLQIAAHEDAFGLERLYRTCEIAREIADDWRIGRVIARPFTGDDARGFERTGNRHDYSMPPPAPTVLDALAGAGGRVVGVGKIGDIFAHQGVTEAVRAAGHPALWRETLAAIDRTADGPDTLVFTNFVDFDERFGHRRDPLGYGDALEAFDARLPELLDRLAPTDLLIVTADHGNDPTHHGTDHTRECIPVLLAGAAVPRARDLGRRETFADVGQTLATHFALPPMDHGTSML